MQTINVILYDFDANRRTEDVMQGRVTSLVCDAYAILREAGQQNVTVCGSETRERHIFKSMSHRVEVGIVRGSERLSRDDHHYLLKYESK